MGSIEAEFPIEARRMSPEAPERRMQSKPVCQSVNREVRRQRGAAIRFDQRHGNGSDGTLHYGSRRRR